MDHISTELDRKPMKFSFIHILFSILLFTSTNFAQSKEISTLYQWETSSGMEWVSIGADDKHPKYEGETKNEEPNGIGTLTYPGGHNFEGVWKDGEQHGKGTFTWSDGRKYSGMFKNGKPYGEGTYTNLDGTVSLGKWKVTQENFIWKTNIDNDAQTKEIKTLFHWETSSGMGWVPIGADSIHPKYEGETINEEPNGIGTLTYPGGHNYEGEWKNGEQYGKGTFTWSDGRKYSGMFKNGKPYEKGTYTHLDGTVKLGKWEVSQDNFFWETKINPFAEVDKKIQGVLSYRKENERWAWYDYGDKELDGKYIGEIKNLKPEGSGTYIYGKGKWEGDKYEGMWKRGKFHGSGNYTRSDGHMFVGEWENNVLNDFTEYDKYGIIVRKYVNGVKVVLGQKTPLSKTIERGTLFRDGPRIKWEEGGKKWFTTGDEKTQGKYEGEILDGVPHGQGTYFWFNVNRYEGEWWYGLFDGQGTYYSYPSGIKVVGEFRRDKEWNTLRYDKDGNIIAKIVRGKLRKY